MEMGKIAFWLEVVEEMSQRGCFSAGFCKVEWDPKHLGTNKFCCFLGNLKYLLCLYKIVLCSGTALEKVGLGQQSLLLIVIVMPMKRKRNTVISECKCLPLLSQMLIPDQKLKVTLASCGTSVNCRVKSRKGLALSSWNVYG